MSDGFFHPDLQVGASVWVITSSEDEMIQVYRDNAMPGQNEMQYSHGSQLGEISGALTHINKLCNKFGLNSVKIEVRCNREEAIKKVQRSHCKPVTSISHFDLVTALHSIMHSTPGEAEFGHVSGYQDDNKTELINDKKLNVIADIRAKVALWECAVSNRQNMENIGNKKISCRINSTNMLPNYYSF